MVLTVVRYSTTTVRGELLLLYWHRRKAGLPRHKKRRKTPLALKGERLQVLLQKEGEYSPGPDRNEILHHNSKMRNTPVVLAPEKGWAPPPQKKGE